MNRKQRTHKLCKKSILHFLLVFQIPLESITLHLYCTVEKLWKYLNLVLLLQNVMIPLRKLFQLVLEQAHILSKSSFIELQNSEFKHISSSRITNFKFQLEFGNKFLEFWLDNFKHFKFDWIWFSQKYKSWNSNFSGFQVRVASSSTTSNYYHFTLSNFQLLFYNSLWFAPFLFDMFMLHTTHIKSHFT